MTLESPAVINDIRTRMVADARTIFGHTRAPRDTREQALMAQTETLIKTIEMLAPAVILPGSAASAKLANKAIEIAGDARAVLDAIKAAG